MKSFTSLLAATDFSIDGNNAVRRAALLAHEHGAYLKIAHVLEPAVCKLVRDWFTPAIGADLEAAQARETLRCLAMEIAGRYDVEVAVEVMVGDPLENLLLASQEFDLLVLGRRGHRRFPRLIVGRTVDRATRLRRGPVLVVKTPAEGPYRQVLVPVDFTVSSDAALGLAARVACIGGLHVFHAINSHGVAPLRGADVPEDVVRATLLRQEAGALARIRRAAAKVGLDSTRLGVGAAHGHPVWATLGQARRVSADLIVAG